MHTIRSIGLTPQQMKLWVDLYKSRTIFKLPDIRPAGVRWAVQQVDLDTGAIALVEALKPMPLTIVILDPPETVARVRQFELPVLPVRVSPQRKPRGWQTLWLSIVGLLFVSAVAVSCQRAQAYELQQCEWLSNQAYSQAWQRDAGVTLAQLKILIRRSDERPEVQTGLIALSRYVYSHREKSPDELAEDLLQDCRSYDR